MASSSPTSEDLSGRVVRRVQQDEACARRDGGAQRVDVEPVVGRPERDGSADRAGEGGIGGVRVVPGLERDDLVAGIAQREERRGEGFGRARGDQHLGVGIDVDAVEPMLMLGDRLAQLGDPDARRILVVAGTDRVDGGLGDDRRSVGVGKALPEVHGAGGHGERRHLGEDCRAGALQAGRSLPTLHDG